MKRNSRNANITRLTLSLLVILPFFLSDFSVAEPIDPNYENTIASGTSFNCARSSAGGVYCWGANASGQLGNGTTTDSLTPVQVHDETDTTYLGNVTQISAGSNHACAVVNGALYCWGSNANGQLGDGTTSNSSHPVRVVGVGGSGYLTGVSHVAAGKNHTCAVIDGYVYPGGYVFCWGANALGQPGDGTTTNSSTPVQVVGVGGSGVLSETVALAQIHGDFSCVIGDFMRPVFCWGDNAHGQLGNYDNTPSSTPVQTLGLYGGGVLSGIMSMSGSSGHVCATNWNGYVFCWGKNDNGELGDGTTNESWLPNVVLDSSGTSYLYGSWMYGFNNLAATDQSTCAKISSGEMYCWGNNSSGQLGDNSNTESHLPVQTVGVGGSGYLSGNIDVGMGAAFGCSADQDGHVFCWGDGDAGNLGNNGTSDSSTPVQVVGPGGSGVLEL